MTPYERADMDRTPRPVAPAPVRPGLHGPRCMMPMQMMHMIQSRCGGKARKGMMPVKDYVSALGEEVINFPALAPLLLHTLALE